MVGNDPDSIVELAMLYLDDGLKDEVINFMTVDGRITLSWYEFVTWLKHRVVAAPPEENSLVDMEALNFRTFANFNDSLQKLREISSRVGSDSPFYISPLVMVTIIIKMLIKDGQSDLAREVGTQPPGTNSRNNAPWTDKNAFINNLRDVGKRYHSTGHFNSPKDPARFSAGWQCCCWQEGQERVQVPRIPWPPYHCGFRNPC